MTTIDLRWGEMTVAEKLNEMKTKLESIESALTFVEGSFMARLELLDAKRMLTDIISKLESS